MWEEQWGRKSRRPPWRTAIMAALIAAWTDGAPAAPADDTRTVVGAAAGAVEVSDDLLGSLRGRFFDGGKIVRFGVEMVSSWQQQTGETLRAALRLEVGLANPARPTVSLSPALSVDKPAGPVAVPGATGTVRGEAAQNVSGVSQSIQLAGDGNRVTNDATLTIAPAAADVVTTASTSAATGAARTELRTDSGAVLSTATDKGSISVSIRTPAGLSVQQIRDATAGRGAGALQMVQVAADGQQIHNMLHMVVGLRPAAAGQIPVSLRQTLFSLRGLPF